MQTGHLAQLSFGCSLFLDSVPYLMENAKHGQKGARPKIYLATCCLHHP
jgi:hypothetical protein